MRLKKSLAKLITWERTCRVATASAAGVPHVVPVCHVLVDGKLYFASDTGARKVRKGPRFRKIRRLLYAKYPQYPDEAALEESEVVIVEVTPAHVFSWGLE